MKYRWWIISGLVMALVLGGALGWMFFNPGSRLTENNQAREQKTGVAARDTPGGDNSMVDQSGQKTGFFFWLTRVASNIVNKTTKSSIKGNLSRNYANLNDYTTVTANDIFNGNVLNKEMEGAKQFGKNTLPLKFTKTDTGLYHSQWLADDGDLARIREDFSRAPFWNLYFYKINYNGKWLTILGQQVENSDGSSAFLHYLLSTNEWTDWGGAEFVVEPYAVIEHQIFDGVNIPPRSFFGSEPNYYERNSSIDQLMDSWHKTGVVPAELQTKILLMSVR